MKLPAWFALCGTRGASLRAHVMLGALAVASGCAPDLRDEYPFDGALPGTDHITHVVQPDGSTVSTVDATNKTSYVYFDLDTGKEVEGAVAVETQSWDLSFQRFKISSNGGGSGPGTCKVLGLKATKFEDLKVAPKDGYQADTADSVFATFEGGWYNYDLNVHKLVPRDLLYVVLSGQGSYFKIQMLDYYDKNGTAAKPTLKWEKISPP